MDKYQEVLDALRGLVGLVQLLPDAERRPLLDNHRYMTAYALVSQLEYSAPQEEICICAAVQFADGRIVRGHRHDSCFITASGWKPKPDLHGHVQGFITSTNRFVDRVEGAELQNSAGIVSAYTDRLVKDLLFSEDLYMQSHDHAAMIAPAVAPPRKATADVEGEGQ